MNAPQNHSVVSPSPILAILNNKPITSLPSGLYISPHALKVFLDMFEGPLDLLLYLIRKHNLDICAIPVAQITSQYLQYVLAMKASDLSLASEYLVMAALLINIKSRLLLPMPLSSDIGTTTQSQHINGDLHNSGIQNINEEGENPASDEAQHLQQQLIAKLIAYERIKDLAVYLGSLKQAPRDYYHPRLSNDNNDKGARDNTKAPQLITTPDSTLVSSIQFLPVTINDIRYAHKRIMARRTKKMAQHEITINSFSLSEYMQKIAKTLTINSHQSATFASLLQALLPETPHSLAPKSTNRRLDAKWLSQHVSTTFMAILELVRGGVVNISHTENNLLLLHPTGNNPSLK